MKIIFGILPVALLGLISCSTMNSHFTCNVTAGDSCLTIEEVEAMTRFTNDLEVKGLKKESRRHSPMQGYVAQTEKGQKIWLAKNIKEQSWG